MFRAAIVMACLLAGCSSPEAEPVHGRLIARAGNEQLGLDDLEPAGYEGLTGADSVKGARKSIERWAASSLFYQEALQNLEPAELNVEAEVAKYRRSLIAYNYQRRVIETSLDTNVTPEETERYYNEHHGSFILKENIVKVFYLKVPVRSPALSKIKKQIWSVNPKDRNTLKELCIQHAESYFIDDSTWLFLDDIRKEIPALREQPDLTLGTGRVVEFSDADYYYFLRIKDVKVKNAMSPLNFERANIRKFILNARKARLINGYKQELLEKAKREKLVEVY